MTIARDEPPPTTPPEAVIAARPAYLAGLTWSALHAGLVVRGRVGNGAQLLPCLQRVEPELLFLDARLETRLGGLEMLRGELDEMLRGGLSVILVAEEIDATLIEQTREIGAAGFLVWPFSQVQLEVTVAAALGCHRAKQADVEGRLRRFSNALNRIAEELADVGLKVATAPETRLRPLPELSSLTPREWDVLNGLVDHRRVATMAREMDISPHTVRNHLKSIFAKLSVRSQAELLDKVVARRITVSPRSSSPAAEGCGIAVVRDRSSDEMRGGSVRSPNSRALGQ